MVKKIRIFIASTPDASQEHERLEFVVKKLTWPGEAANKLGMTLEILNWETYTAPFMKKARGVIEDDLPLKEGDLFIGIIRFCFCRQVNLPSETRAGRTPKPGIDTEEIFNYAYTSWKRTGYPHFMLFRSHRSFIPTDIDPHQFQRIQLFFEKYSRGSQLPSLYKAFKDMDQFEEIVYKDLSNYLKDIERKHLLSMQIKPLSLQIPISPTDTIPGESKEDESHEMVFLKVNSLYRNTLFSDYHAETIGLLVSNYRNFVLEIIKKYKGVLISWGTEGGTWAFLGEDMYERAVSAGVELVENQTNFNGDKNLNPIGKPLKPRLAAYCDSIEIGFPINKTYTSCINYVSYLEKHETPMGTFVITENLFQNLNPTLKEKLSYERSFEYVSLYSIKVPYPGECLSENELEHLYIKMTDNSAILLESLSLAVLSTNNRDYADIRKYVEKFYKDCEYLCHRIQDYDTVWLAAYMKKAEHLIKSFLKEDERIFMALDDLNRRLKFIGNQNTGLLSIREFIGAFRTNSIPNLQFLLYQFRRRPTGKDDIIVIAREYFREKVVDFIEADDFHIETALVELFLTKRDMLIDYILKDCRDPYHNKLITRFWQLSDFVLIEDEYTEKTQKIFPILSKDSKKGKYFHVIRQFLFEELRPENGEVRSLFEKIGISPSIKDIIVTLKSILITHPQHEARAIVLRNINFQDLWSIIAYSKTPLVVLREIAEHLNKHKDEDRMQVYFDLTLLVLMNKTITLTEPSLLHLIRSIIQIFYKFNFFINEGYFKRLNDLTLKFQARAGRYYIEFIEESHKRLEKEYKERGGFPTRQPKCLTELPLVIRRKMARDGHYLEFFCISTNNTIAEEVYRYINYNNIGRFVSNTAINRVLFNKLLRKEELFHYPSNVYAALCNPKCNLDFAVRHFSKLPRTELKKIASNPIVNPDVRTFIRGKLSKSRFPG